MKCKFCLAEIEEDVLLCPFCGKALEEESELTNLAEQSTEKTENKYSLSDKDEQFSPTGGVDFFGKDLFVKKSDEDSAPMNSSFFENEEAAEDEENMEAPPTEPKKPLSKRTKIILISVAGVALAALLTWLILWGMGVKWSSVTSFFGFTEADITYKNSYTVSEKKLEKKKGVVVATLGDQTLTNEELQVYYWLSVNEFVSQYGNYLSAIGMDLSKSLDEQMYDEATGVTWQQFFLEGALETWRRYASIVQMAQRDGYVLTPELQAYMASYNQVMASSAAEAGYPNAEAWIDSALSPGCSLTGLYDYNLTEYTALGYLDSIEAQMAPSMAEMEAYYAANETVLINSGYSKDAGNYYNVRHILLGVEGESTTDEKGKKVYTDEQWEACRVKAQTMLDEFLAADPTEEKFAELAMKNSKDSGSAANGGLYENITKDGINENCTVIPLVESFTAWYMEAGRKTGDTGLVKTDYGYHIMYFSSSTPIWEAEVNPLVRSEKLQAMLDEAKVQWPVEFHYKKIVLGDAKLTQGSTTATK